MTTDKEKKILALLNQIIEESQRIDMKLRIEKAKKGEIDEKGDSFITYHLKNLKELITS
jgi:hypothetical protein